MSYFMEVTPAIFPRMSLNELPDAALVVVAVVVVAVVVLVAVVVFVAVDVLLVVV